MKTRNFHSTLETETRITPHAQFEALAIDAALLSVDPQLPTLSDEDHQRIVDAAQIAARTVLALAHVPTDWMSFLEAMHSDRSTKLRQELKDCIYELLPPKPTQITAAQVEALERVRRCAGPKGYESLHAAMLDLEEAYAWENIELIEQAFCLGYDIAHDPSRLVFAKGCA